MFLLSSLAAALGQIFHRPFRPNRCVYARREIGSLRWNGRLENEGEVEKCTYMCLGASRRSLSEGGSEDLTRDGEVENNTNTPRRSGRASFPI